MIRRIILYAKRIMKPVVSIIISGLLFINCQKEIKNDSPSSLPFEMTPDTTYIIPGQVDEASGIADSKKNPGNLWVEEDSGNPPELTLLSHSGTIQKKIYIKGAQNRDWEDLVIGNGPIPGENYIYLAETGDNNANYTNYAIYRFIEPSQSADTVFTWDKLKFQYPDGPHDAETILTDNETNDIYIITKRDSLSRVYKFSYPQNTSNITTVSFVGEMRVSGICSAAISPDGKELLTKNYTNIYYWKRAVGESIPSALKRIPVTLGYVLEPQGEAICFKNNNSAFYTLSEKPFFATHVKLNFYKRK